MITAIQLLTAVWNKHTDQDLHPRAGERIFSQFVQAGFTEDNLRVVLTWIKYKNSKNDKKRSLNLRLVLDPYGEYPFEKFAFDLSEASAWERNLIKKKTERDRVLEASGRSAEGTEGKPRHVSEIFATLTQPKPHL